jgi:hypothetical protein
MSQMWGPHRIGAKPILGAGGPVPIRSEIGDGDYPESMSSRGDRGSPSNRVPGSPFVFETGPTVREMLFNEFQYYLAQFS